MTARSQWPTRSSSLACWYEFAPAQPTITRQSTVAVAFFQNFIEKVPFSKSKIASLRDPQPLHLGLGESDEPHVDRLVTDLTEYELAEQRVACARVVGLLTLLDDGDGMLPGPERAQELERDVRRPRRRYGRRDARADVKRLARLGRPGRRRGRRDPGGIPQHEEVTPGIGGPAPGRRAEVLRREHG